MSNLEELVVFYLELCQYEKKLSQDTLKAYRIDLRQFTCFCAGRGVEKTSSAAMSNT